MSTRLETFNTYRDLLFSVAYRMLGSARDAEDMVQETFIRWQLSSDVDIRSPRAFLVTIVSRLCIHQLESARASREAYVGQWLPEPIATDEDSDPLAASELHESLSIAFLILLEELTPVERAAFLLHEVFDYEYADVAAIVGKSEAACRQILHRARARITQRRPRFQPSAEQHERLLRSFVLASTSGDFEQLVALLSHEVVLYSDGGGKRDAALRPVHGADHVARFVLSAMRRSVPNEATLGFERTNGAPSVVYRLPDGSAGCVLSVETVDDRIRALYIVTNPEKLERLARVSC